MKPEPDPPVCPECDGEIYEGGVVTPHRVYCRDHAPDPEDLR